MSVGVTGWSDGKPGAGLDGRRMRYQRGAGPVDVTGLPRIDDGQIVAYYELDGDSLAVYTPAGVWAGTLALDALREIGRCLDVAGIESEVTRAMLAGAQLGPSPARACVEAALLGTRVDRK